MATRVASGTTEARILVWIADEGPQRLADTVVELPQHSKRSCQHALDRLVNKGLLHREKIDNERYYCMTLLGMSRVEVVEGEAS